jgi:hypothetical protein
MTHRCRREHRLFQGTGKHALELKDGHLGTTTLAGEEPLVWSPDRARALSPPAWPNRPTRNRAPPAAPLTHDGALVRSRSTPGSPTVYVRAVNASEVAMIPRRAVGLALYGDLRAKHANIRQALIDWFGGSAAIARKAAPGPLYGISRDTWSALAIAITYSIQPGITEAA